MHTLVLFDIDGTLLSSSSAGRRSIERAFAAEFDDLTFFEQVRFDGKTDPQIVRELYHAAGAPERATLDGTTALLARYIAQLEVEIAERGHLVRSLPGVPALLDALEAVDGVCVGLLTGNVIAGAQLKLGAAGLDFGRFRLGAYGSDHADRPMLPAIAADRAAPFFGRVPHGTEVVILGDTPADVTCGNGIGARAVAVATGSYSADTLRDAGTATVFDTFDATEAVLEAILCPTAR